MSHQHCYTMEFPIRVEYEWYTCLDFTTVSAILGWNHTGINIMLEELLTKKYHYHVKTRKFQNNEQTPFSLLNQYELYFL